MKQFNKIIEFRQGIYERGLTRARDAQFELLDALLLSPAIRSFPELSLSPVFRRDWPSAYVAIEQGQQDQEWLESWFMQQIPQEGIQVFSLDGTDRPHPQARVMADRQYVHAASSAVNGGTIVVGHPHSVLAWAPERHSSWAPVVSIRRVVSHKTEVEVGVEQVTRLCRHRQAEMKQWFHLIAADGRYGNHRFFGPLKELPCGKIARMRCDRVLYGAPGLYGGRGRPRVHGDRFAFKQPETWGEPVGMVALQDERWGQVRLRRWDGRHAREDASTVFSVILVETHLERDKPCKPFWLGYQYPADQTPEEPGLQDLWYGYQHRWPVEPSIRFRKQHLYWTLYQLLVQAPCIFVDFRSYGSCITRSLLAQLVLPRFQTPERCDRWTMLVNIAQWELFLARDLVQDRPLPWQPAQTKLTPERVRQSLAGLFSQIGTPADPPQTRGNSPGWPKGRSRTRPERHKVVKKTQSKPKPA